MKPISLELDGFTGITSGFGKDRVYLDLTTVPNDARLVALVGPNGTGKSTIMDNLHPYRVMPSRSSTLGPGGFSYWDNISKPTAKKDLVWEHSGRRYRSTLAFKVSGKTRKADCYLFVWDDPDAKWVPMSLDDGTLSDGKAETYDRCIEAILGVPESFFTSQFSAQTRRAISEYGASDVKALLASILDLQSYRALSAKAAAVAKLLRFHLESLQDEISQSRGAEAEIKVITLELDDLALSAQSCKSAEVIAAERLEAARKVLAMLEAKQASHAKVADEVRFLNEQLARARANAGQQIAKECEQMRAQSTRIESDFKKAKAEKESAERGIKIACEEVARLESIVGMGQLVQEAVRKLPEARAKVAGLDDRVEQERAKLANARAINEKLQESMRRQGELEVEGTAQTATIARLEETASLIQRVPCGGTDYQSRCLLLAQANQAQSGVGQHQAVLQDMRSKYREVRHAVEDLKSRTAAFHAVEEEIRKLNQQRQAAMQIVDHLVETAAKSALLEEAERRLPQVRAAAAEHESSVAASSTVMSHCDGLLQSLKEAHESAIADIQARLDTEIHSLSQRLAGLESPIGDDKMAAAKQEVQDALASLEGARAKSESLVHRRLSLQAKIEAFRVIQQKAARTVTEAERLSEEIAKWKLIEKGLGNDGMVALSIDDAGPEIAALCNSLLHDCYDGRFSVRLDTQRTTQTGNIRETFEIVVFDNHRGEGKSLGMMSGGERVWVNECLTRAIALHVGQSGKVTFDTLFTDEADGPLDPSRKRQFMKMKRAVLERGGYKREYFISQTPELWELADHVIDVAAL